MKTKSLVLVFFIFFSLSCSKEIKNTDCNFIKDLSEIRLKIRYSMSINNVTKRLIKIKKIDSISFKFSEIGYGYTANGNDTLTREIMKTLKKNSISHIQELITKIDEKKLSKTPVIKGFDGSFYELTYGDGLNFKYFEFQSPFSSSRKNLDEFRIVIDEILKFSSEPYSRF